MSEKGYKNSGFRNSGHRNSGCPNAELPELGIRLETASKIVSALTSGDYNSGYRNSGNCNSGKYNSGYRNSGFRNSGSWNSGNRNSGSCNSGDYNSGHRNSGSWNSGSYNSGDYNSGHRNSGSWNSGCWNSGDWNTTSYAAGCFNTEPQKLKFFDKETNLTMVEWGNTLAYETLSRMPTNKIDWIESEDMTEEEKLAHPEHETTGGFLREYKLTHTRNDWWSGLFDVEREAIREMPNFDAKKFYKITGIDTESGGKE